MSEHEWKPGDVAMVMAKVAGGPTLPHRAIRTNKGSWRCELADVCVVPDDYATRPLLVIDPEDLAEVTRLTDWMQANGWTGLDHEAPLDMQAALRALASPTPEPLPEPSDPAVRVRDADGLLWARLGSQWHSEDSLSYCWEQAWHERGPLRIVTPDAPTPDAGRPLKVGDRVRVSHGALTGHGTSSVSPDVFGEIGVIQETPRKFKSSFLVAFERGLPGRQFIGGDHLTRIPGGEA